MTEIQGKLILVRVSEGSSYRESTVVIYVKGVPFFSGRYVKGVPFISKMVYKMI